MIKVNGLCYVYFHKGNPPGLPFLLPGLEQINPAGFWPKGMAAYPDGQTLPRRLHSLNPGPFCRIKILWPSSCFQQWSSTASRSELCHQSPVPLWPQTVCPAGLSDKQMISLASGCPVSHCLEEDVMEQTSGATPRKLAGLLVTRTLNLSLPNPCKGNDIQLNSAGLYILHKIRNTSIGC